MADTVQLKNKKTGEMVTLRRKTGTSFGSVARNVGNRAANAAILGQTGFGSTSPPKQTALNAASTLPVMGQEAGRMAGLAIPGVGPVVSPVTAGLGYGVGSLAQQTVKKALGEGDFDIKKTLSDSAVTAAIEVIVGFGVNRLARVPFLNDKLKQVTDVVRHQEDVIRKSGDFVPSSNILKVINKSTEGLSFTRKKLGKLIGDIGGDLVTKVDKKGGIVKLGKSTLNIDDLKELRDIVATVGKPERASVAGLTGKELKVLRNIGKGIKDEIAAMGNKAGFKNFGKNVTKIHNINNKIKAFNKPSALKEIATSGLAVGALGPVMGYAPAAGAVLGARALKQPIVQSALGVARRPAVLGASKVAREMND